MSPETIDAMLDAGATAEVIAAAWKAEIAEQAKATEIRRAKDRDRQRRHRESRDVTRTKCDASPNDKDILTPSLTPNGISDEIPPPVENELKPEHVVEVWNDLATKHGLPAVKKLTPERRKKLTSFIRRWSIDDITEAIEAIPRSPFLPKSRAVFASWHGLHRF